jgi:hypothetical protein
MTQHEFDFILPVASSDVESQIFGGLSNLQIYLEKNPLFKIQINLIRLKKYFPIFFLHNSYTFFPLGSSEKKQIEPAGRSFYRHLKAILGKSDLSNVTQQSSDHNQGQTRNKLLMRSNLFLADLFSKNDIFTC